MSVSLGIGAGPGELGAVSRSLLFSAVDRSRTKSTVNSLPRPVTQEHTQLLPDSSPKLQEEGRMPSENGDVPEAVTPTFGHPDPPSLVALDTHSMNLQWKAVQQLTPDPIQTTLPRCLLKYNLEMQRVGGLIAFSPVHLLLCVKLKASISSSTSPCRCLIHRPPTALRHPQKASGAAVTTALIPSYRYAPCHSVKVSWPGCACI